MPFLDVTSVLTDPDFADSFTVERRSEVVDEYGRSIQTILPFRTSGVVTVGSPNDLDRPEEYEKFTRSITVVTKARLRGAVQGFQPDVIVWRDSRFVVKAIDLYPHFGAGFYQIEAESMEMVDNNTDPTSEGKFIFNNVANAGFVGVL
jgi:hypothetical protein